MKIPHFLVLIGLSLLLNSHGELRAGNVFPAGANQFANATVIDSNGGKSDVTDLSGFTTEVGEPVHRPGPNLASNKTAWWKWTAPADGLFVADTLAGDQSSASF